MKKQNLIAPTAIFFQKKIARKKIATDKRDVDMKNLPIFLNRAQMAGAANVPLRRIYKTKITPDAVDAKMAPLFSAKRVSEIAQLCSRPEVTA
jgi:hypothetical protein